MTVIDTSTLDFSEPVASASYREIIETIISSLENGTNAMVSHTDNGELWKFAYGSVEVFVLLTGETDDDFLMVWSPVLALPVTDEPGLLRHLLELNWTDTFEASFALANGQVIVTSQRTVAELSPGEVARAITLVADIADDNDERLAAEYNS
ncbi:MAG: YbjN domain-containing protein [Cyanobacteria bacterium P01_H01_bin.15]